MRDASGRDDTPLSVEQVELVALDLEGTLLRADRTLSPETAEAVAAALARGVHVVLVTGYGPRPIRRVYQHLGLRTPVIACGGALVFDPHGNEILKHRPLHSALAKDVVNVSRAAGPDCGVTLEVGDRRFAEGPPLAAGGPADHAAGAGGSLGGTLAPLSHDAAAYRAALEGPVTRIMLGDAPDALARIEATLTDRLGEQLSLARVGPRVLAAVHFQADKTRALAYVAKRLGVPRERVMVIARGGGDLGLLQWAGMRVALRDADDAVRRAAGFATGPRDGDGVAHALRQYATGK